MTPYPTNLVIARSEATKQSIFAATPTGLAVVIGPATTRHAALGAASTTFPANP